MGNNGYNSLLLSYPKRKFLTFNELKTRPKADFIAAPFRRDLPRARRSQSRNEIYSLNRYVQAVERFYVKIK